MTKFLLPALAAISLAAAPAAFAATSHSKPAATKTASVDKTKAAKCQSEWKAQKKHEQTHKAFMAACEARA